MNNEQIREAAAWTITCYNQYKEAEWLRLGTTARNKKEWATCGTIKYELSKADDKAARAKIWALVSNVIK